MRSTSKRGETAQALLDLSAAEERDDGHFAKRIEELKLQLG